jgi:hypothetical protein
MIDFGHIPWGRFEFDRNRYSPCMIRVLSTFGIGAKDVSMHQSYDALSCAEVRNNIKSDTDFTVATAYFIVKRFGLKISDLDDEFDDLCVSHYRAGDVDVILLVEWVERYGIITDIKSELGFERFVGDNVGKLTSDMVNRIHFGKDK